MLNKLFDSLHSLNSPALETLVASFPLLVTSIACLILIDSPSIVPIFLGGVAFQFIWLFLLTRSVTRNRDSSAIRNTGMISLGAIVGWSLGGLGGISSAPIALKAWPYPNSNVIEKSLSLEQSKQEFVGMLTGSTHMVSGAGIVVGSTHTISAEDGAAAMKAAGITVDRNGFYIDGVGISQKERDENRRWLFGVESH